MLNLPKSERIWQSILDYSPDGILVLNSEEKIIVANKKACEQIGCDLDEIAGKNYSSILPKPMINLHVQHIAEAKKNKFAVRWNDHIGSRYFSLTAIPVEENEYTLLFCQEVTELKRVQDSEQDKRSRLKTLIETIPDLIWLQDIEGSYVNCNSKFERFIGVAEAELKGRSTHDFLPQELADSFCRSFVNVLGNSKSVVNREWITYANDGHKEYVEIIHTPFIDHLGVLIGVMGIARDVTAFKQNADNLRRHRDELEQIVSERTEDLSRALMQLKRAQSDLLEAEKLTSLGSVVAGISHELNTPIGIIITASSTLLAEYTAFSKELAQGMVKRSTLNNRIDRDSEILELIFRSARRAADLLDNFKKVAIEQTAEHRRTFDLRDVVANSLDSVLPAFDKMRIEITNQVPNGIECDGYPGPLGQVITNLVQNCFIHAFEGRARGKVEISCVDNGDSITIKVNDDGIGMSATTLVHIFDPFFTTKLGKGGSGLGMSICKRIANSVLGGDLTVNSLLECGSTFSLTMLRTASGSNLAS